MDIMSPSSLSDRACPRQTSTRRGDLRVSGAAALVCGGLRVRGRAALARGSLHVRATKRESDGALLAIVPAGCRLGRAVMVEVAQPVRRLQLDPGARASGYRRRRRHFGSVGEQP